ncbi:MAG: DUF883 family protein [Verrucomicrobia bacterium]|nr:MAG: DUF883 family protein [Verrucomicrobiota bacterium]
MTDPLSHATSLDPDTGFTPLPSVGQAANDLRAAAGEKARELAHNVGAQASSLKELAIGSAQHFREVAGEKVGQLKASAAEKAEEIRHSAAEHAQRLQESAAEQWHDTRVLTKEFHLTAEDYIRQNPTKCVVGALGLGVLIGLIVRR